MTWKCDRKASENEVLKHGGPWQVNLHGNMEGRFQKVKS